MSFWNGFPRGFLNKAGFSKYPRLQAKTGVCGAQYLDVSAEIDKNVVQERISDGMRDQISRKYLQCYFKLWGLGCMLGCADRVLAALRWARMHVESAVKVV